MAGMQETDHVTLKNGITYLLQDAKAREKLAELLTEVMEKYGPDNPPPYPVASVNGETGDVNIPTVDLPVSVQNGGTGATTAAQVAKNLNVLPLGEVVTKIPSGADLNNYTTPGVYAVHTNVIAQSLVNKPVDFAGTLRVFCSNGADINSVSSKYLIQEYIDFTGQRYQRNGGSEGSSTVTWYPWRFVGPQFANHALIPYSSFTSTNGTIWGTESYLDIWWDNQKVIMSGYILLKDVSAGILRVVFQRPAGLPAFNILIGGETFRRGANASMLAGDFCYISNSNSNEIIAERNMFTSHPAADYARIDINCAIGSF